MATTSSAAPAQVDEARMKSVDAKNKAALTITVASHWGRLPIRP